MKLDTTTAKNAINIVLPIVLGGGILYWMYRGFDFGKLSDVCMHEMDWWWMGFSLIFGVTAQMFRGLRWKLALEPLGEKPRTANCIDAIFISYASSIIIPRIGEVSRCGILKQYDGTSFSKSLGTVVTERVIDSILVMVMTVVTFLVQIRMFSTFFDKTGTNLNSITERFTTTGYIVTAICGAAAIFFIWFLTKRIAVFAKVKEMMGNMKAGILSLKDVKNKWLFTAYTLLIWISYFLHFYITFNCFGFTTDLSISVALVAFVVGSIAVIVPTPNGAGPWHFAVKTILVLNGVGEDDAVTFALIVHTIQTSLTALLGVYAILALQGRKIRKEIKEQTGQPFNK